MESDSTWLPALAMRTLSASITWQAHDWVFIAAIMLALVLAGTASASETAITGLNGIRLHEQA
ncbi:MAG TPA: hypothetical protein VF807_05115, partial [Ktedonobacterales bacterium]